MTLNRTAFALALTAALLIWAGFSFGSIAPDSPVDHGNDLAPSPSLTEVLSWNVDKAHSEVTFSVRHLGISRVTGAFHDFDATVEVDPDNLHTLQTAATVQIASIDTRNEDRDDHLRSDDFFDAVSYPTMSFESTGISNVDGSTFTLEGDLTIKDVTKSVAFDAAFVGAAQGPMGNERAAFTATTIIDRTEYGLMWNRLTEAGGVVVGHDVTINLDIQTVKSE